MFITPVLKNLGRAVLGPIEYAADLAAMTYFALRAAIFDQARGWREITRVVSAQVHFTGVEALPLITILGLAAGGLITAQATTSFGSLAGVTGPGRLLVIIVLRELAPLLTALIVVARSGTAVTSELGNMRVNREIEALEAMGIHPLGYVVFPRLIGGVVSVVCLGIYFAALATFAGALISLRAGSLGYYLDNVAAAVDGTDFVWFLAKTALGGAIIFTTCCHRGMTVARAPHEVPQAATRAVVNSVLAVVFVNAAITLGGLL